MAKKEFNPFMQCQTSLINNQTPGGTLKNSKKVFKATTLKLLFSLVF